ncbi:electron transfer flavoprotein subunit alpha/FixB family protein [Gluconacetobacter diazotrophicus]|uniref:FixB n=1 Tax=Gluconacetobacter diazotrophicus (strain ATCC 49037 / DSM 5601 / CCUG 37298 / CIP 103539 / LMG 7603 / PAl5) TaxID=272568 RepID=A9H5Z9_GLUDA|nr:electron transfer flavoprotein subunit alpha/FixB family protein [Gluconacetobacter diazotrophicus]CAP54395.1 fixB [Gluconacetobacter diazotrophicus PA1 5]
MNAKPTGGAPGGRANMKKELSERFQRYRHVWVFVEFEHGKIHPVSLELLGEGRKLADQLQVELAGIVLGSGRAELDEAARAAFSYGADVVYLADDPVLANYRNEPYTQVMTALVNAYEPEIVPSGRHGPGPRPGRRRRDDAKTGLTADCTELAIDGERSLAATRPTFGGSLLCTIHTLNYRPQMATVRPRVMAMPEAQPGRTGRIVEFKVDVAEDSIITKVLDFLPDTANEAEQMAFADIVVAGGMGLRSAENLGLVRDLAAVLGGDWGGSRPLVQKGWIPSDRQIGQTGKTIRPRLYIAAGISGAIQHRVGVEGADLIVAINTDPNAPIFDFAHVGIVADAITLLPALTEAFGRRLSVNRMAS